MKDHIRNHAFRTALIFSVLFLLAACTDQAKTTVPTASSPAPLQLVEFYSPL